MLTLSYNLSFGAYFLAVVFYAASLFSLRKIFLNVARFFIACGIFCLLVYIGARWFIASRPPFSNMFESMVLFSWTIGLACLIIDSKYKIKSISAVTALLSLLAIGGASLLDKEIAPLLPALKSNWLTIHVLTCFVGYAALVVSFAASMLFLVFLKKNKNLDTICYKAITFGFLFLTLGIITGAIWANSAWGTYWSWDPKETWSLITWLIYAIYLHLRFKKGWTGRKATWLSILGFLAVIFTYFGVNYLLFGLHSYASS